MRFSAKCVNSDSTKSAEWLYHSATNIDSSRLQIGPRNLGKSFFVYANKTKPQGHSVHIFCGNQTMNDLPIVVSASFLLKFNIKISHFQNYGDISSQTELQKQSSKL